MPVPLVLLPGLVAAPPGVVLLGVVEEVEEVGRVDDVDGVDDDVDGVGEADGLPPKVSVIDWHPAESAARTARPSTVVGY
jgi:hypothetical protein